MNSNLILSNYLLVLKSTVEVYVHGTLESSNDDVRSLLKESLNEILSCQANTYNKLVELGSYSVSNVNSDKISAVLNKISNKN